MRKRGSRLHGRSFSQDVLWSVAANFFAMLVMALVSFVLPKSLGPIRYAYWSLYVLYSQYIGYLTLGLSDGLHVRYSGRDYEEMPKALCRFQFFLLLGFHLAADLVFLFVYSLCAPAADFYCLAAAVCIGGLLFVPKAYLLMLLQASRRVRAYSTVTVIERLVLLCGMLVLTAAGVDTFLPYLAADLLGKLLSLFAATAYTRDLFFPRSAAEEQRQSVRERGRKSFAMGMVGMHIVLANFSTVLMNGIIRNFIQYRWGLKQFGYVSLAFTFSNIVMTLILSISVVFFPYLKNLPGEKLGALYTSLGRKLFTALLLLMFCYFPLKWVLQFALPSYGLSIRYLSLLFPMSIFEAKYRLLINNYLKAMREERYLLLSNLFMIALTFVAAYMTTVLFRQMDAAVLLIVVLFALRALAGEAYLARKLTLGWKRDALVQVILSAGFIVLTWYGNGAISFLGYLLLAAGLAAAERIRARGERRAPAEE